MKTLTTSRPKPSMALLVHTLLVALLVSVLSPGISRAQGYLGASAVLRQVEARTAKPGQNTNQDLTTQLRDDLKAFSRTSSSLTPAEAAKRWLELVDRAVKVQRETAQNYNPSAVQIGGNDLMRALPPPADWDALAKAIAARPPAKGGGKVREAGLRLLAVTLTDDAAGRAREITNLLAMAKKADSQSENFYDNILSQIGQALPTVSDDPATILQSLSYQLIYADGQSVCQLQVPNLVPKIGAQRTEAFLRKVLVMPNVTLQFNAPNQTSQLAQKLALELINQLKTPQWGLVNSLNAVQLYEAMDKKFGVQTNNLSALPGLANLPSGTRSLNQSGDYEKQEAEPYYLTGLIRQGRTNDAVAFAKRFKGQDVPYLFGDAFNLLERAGYTAALDNFLHKILIQDPTLPLWDQYAQVAANAGRTRRMLALVRATIARNDLSDREQTELHQILFKALLAVDDIDGAMQQARSLMALNAKRPSDNGYDTGDLGVMIAHIGLLVHRPQLTEEGIAAVKKWLATPAGQNLANGDASDVIESLTQILFQSKRGPEAESILTDALVNAVRAGNAQTGFGWSGSPPTRQILTTLATLYFEAGRYNDVLTLLKQSPDWGAKDLSALFNSYAWKNPITVMGLKTGSSPMPVPYLAARSLLATGHKEQARKITYALLNRYPGLDRGYELLLALDGTNAIPYLDELFSRDRFQERPLIWKAHLLREENRLAQAEKVIRQAIAIDPTDGEEGRGDRLRAYSELADILAARGDTKGADFNREIVKSVRMSEDADEFYRAGLLSRAISIYKKALKHFSDAYCIQVRLAIQLADLGKNQQAEEHYRRAYELMPESFGRASQQCFGCESDFASALAQRIAKQVFTRLAAKEPNKPQVHYFLGYLLEQQEHNGEALTNYLAAVRLDPDYLNAWVELQQVSYQALISPRLRDEIAFNILRLDPLQRYTQVDWTRVNDPRGVWKAVADAVSHRPPAITNLLTLDTSKLALGKKEANLGSARQAGQFGMTDQWQMERERFSPGFAVAQTPFVQIAGQMILNGDADDSGD